MADTLFTHIERLQGGEPWGEVLDAGTGEHSLAWICSLETRAWTAVTADSGRADSLIRKLGTKVRKRDRIIAGNWTDPAFLHGETFDVVLADYLLGAVERFAPYFQEDLFRRLRPHVRRRFYVVGLEPLPGYRAGALGPGGRVLVEVAHLRDACILHAGQRPYREYPLEWVTANLERHGFAIDEVARFPNVYGERFITEQLQVAASKLPHVADRALARALESSINRLRKRALALYETHRGIVLGEDYVIAARVVV